MLSKESQNLVIIRTDDIFNDDSNRFDIRALKHLFAYFCLCDDMNND